MTAREKAKFRSSSKWKKFRAYMKKKCGGIDLVTRKPLYSGWQLHHADPANYDDLDEKKFLPCNKKTHAALHWLLPYWKEQHEEVLASLALWLRAMELYEK